MYKAVVLLCSLVAFARPEGYFHQQYQYSRKAETYRDNELEHREGDEGFYSKHGDLDGTRAPKVNSHSTHSEYTNPKFQNQRSGNLAYGQSNYDNTYGSNSRLGSGYQQGLGLSNYESANGYGAQSSQYSSSSYAANTGYGSTGVVGTHSTYTPTSSQLQALSRQVQDELSRKLQSAIRNQYQSHSSYFASGSFSRNSGGYNNLINSDIGELEEGLRHNLTRQLQEVLSRQYATTFPNPYTTTGNLRQEFEELKQHVEQNLINELREGVRSQYQYYADSPSTTRLYRPASHVVPSNRGYSHSSSWSSKQEYQYQPTQTTPSYPSIPISDVINRVEEETRNKLQEALVRVDQEFNEQSSYAYTTGTRPSVDHTSQLQKLTNQLMHNLTETLEMELQRTYGTHEQRGAYVYDSLQSRPIYRIQDLEDRKRQIEDDLKRYLHENYRQKYNDFVQRSAYVSQQRSQTDHTQNQYYRPVVRLSPVSSSESERSYKTLSYNRQSGYEYQPSQYPQELREIANEVQTDLNHQLQSALYEQEKQLRHMMSYSAGQRSYPNYDETLQELQDELRRNFTNKLDESLRRRYRVESQSGAYFFSTSGGSSNAQMQHQLEQMRNALQSQLMRQLEQGLSRQQSYFSASSSSSSSSSASSGVKSARFTQYPSYSQNLGSSLTYGEDCEMQGDDPHSHHRSTRSTHTDQEYLLQQRQQEEILEDLTQQQENQYDDFEKLQKQQNAPTNDAQQTEKIDDLKDVNSKPIRGYSTSYPYDGTWRYYSSRYHHHHSNEDQRNYRSGHHLIHRNRYQNFPYQQENQLEQQETGLQFESYTKPKSAGRFTQGEQVENDFGNQQQPDNLFEENIRQKSADDLTQKQKTIQGLEFGTYRPSRRPTPQQHSTAVLTQQSGDLTQQPETTGLEMGTQRRTGQLQFGSYIPTSPRPQHQEDLTQQTETGDLTQQAETGDLTQQAETGDLIQQAETGDLTQQQENTRGLEFGSYRITNGRLKSQQQDLTQQAKLEDLTQQQETVGGLEFGSYGPINRRPKPQQQGLAEQAQSGDLTQQQQTTGGLRFGSYRPINKRLKPQQQRDLTEQAQSGDLTQQQTVGLELGSYRPINRRPKPQQQQELTEQAQSEDQTQQQQLIGGLEFGSYKPIDIRPKPQKQEDFTQQVQSRDLSQQQENIGGLEFGSYRPSRKPKPQQQNLTQQVQSEDLNQQVQSEDLTHQQEITGGLEFGSYRSNRKPTPQFYSTTVIAQHKPNQQVQAEDLTQQQEYNDVTLQPGNRLQFDKSQLNKRPSVRPQRIYNGQSEDFNQQSEDLTQLEQSSNLQLNKKPSSPLSALSLGTQQEQSVDLIQQQEKTKHLAQQQESGLQFNKYQLNNRSSTQPQRKPNDQLEDFIQREQTSDFTQQQEQLEDLTQQQQTGLQFGRQNTSRPLVSVSPTLAGLSKNLQTMYNEQLDDLTQYHQQQSEDLLQQPEKISEQFTNYQASGKTTPQPSVRSVEDQLADIIQQQESEDLTKQEEGELQFSNYQPNRTSTKKPATQSQVKYNDHLTDLARQHSEDLIQQQEQLEELTQQQEGRLQFGNHQSNRKSTPRPLTQPQGIYSDQLSDFNQQQQSEDLTQQQEQLEELTQQQESGLSFGNYQSNQKSTPRPLIQPQGIYSDQIHDLNQQQQFEDLTQQQEQLEELTQQQESGLSFGNYQSNRKSTQRPLTQPQGIYNVQLHDSNQQEQSEDLTQQQEQLEELTQQQESRLQFSNYQSNRKSTPRPLTRPQEIYSDQVLSQRHQYADFTQQQEQPDNLNNHESGLQFGKATQKPFAQSQTKFEDLAQKQQPDDFFQQQENVEDGLQFGNYQLTRKPTEHAQSPANNVTRGQLSSYNHSSHNRGDIGISDQDDNLTQQKQTSLAENPERNPQISGLQFGHSNNQVQGVTEEEQEQQLLVDGIEQQQGVTQNVESASNSNYHTSSSQINSNEERRLNQNNRQSILSPYGLHNSQSTMPGYFMLQQYPYIIGQGAQYERDTEHLPSQSQIYQANQGQIQDSLETVDEFYSLTTEKQTASVVQNVDNQAVRHVKGGVNSLSPYHSQFLQRQYQSPNFAAQYNIEPVSSYDRTETTENPGFWKKIGNKIENTFTSAKQTASSWADKIRGSIG